jgi:tRNA modification GTPase
MLAALRHAKTESGIQMLLAQPAAWRTLLDTKPDAATIEQMLADRTLDRLLQPARVAIVGPPNVGKSTLANQLFAQERSITADLPGTTRDWVGEIANLDGVPVMLLDTPGVRETADEIEHRAIEASREIVRGADVIVYVIDAGDPHVPATKDSIIRVLNKVDRGTPPGLEYDVATVATRGQGIDELRMLIRTRLGCDDLTVSMPRCWTDRQRQVLRNLLK